MPAWENFLVSLPKVPSWTTVIQQSITYVAHSHLRDPRTETSEGGQIIEIRRGMKGVRQRWEQQMQSGVYQGSQQMP